MGRYFCGEINTFFASARQIDKKEPALANSFFEQSHAANRLSFDSAIGVVANRARPLAQFLSPVICLAYERVNHATLILRVVRWPPLIIGSAKVPILL